MVSRVNRCICIVRFWCTTYDVLTLQPTADACQIERKDFKLAMRLGKSNHYKVGDIFGRHIEETGLASGLSREAIASGFASIHQNGRAALDRTFSALPTDFPGILAEAISAAFDDRLKRLNQNSKALDAELSLWIKRSVVQLLPAVPLPTMAYGRNPTC